MGYQTNQCTFGFTEREEQSMIFEKIKGLFVKERVSNVVDFSPKKSKGENVMSNVKKNKEKIDKIMSKHKLDMDFENDCWENKTIPEVREWKNLMREAIWMLEGVGEIVRDYKIKNPDVKAWKENWIKEAKKLLSDDETQSNNRTFFYHLRGYDMRPIVTICLLKQGNEYARGVSICSKKEMPVKAVGRKIALERALEAMSTKQDGDDVVRWNALNVIDAVVDQVEESLLLLQKSMYMPTLTAFEKRLCRIEE